MSPTLIRRTALALLCSAALAVPAAAFAQAPAKKELVAGCARPSFLQ